jgi:hypothetical protein
VQKKKNKWKKRILLIIFSSYIPQKSMEGGNRDYYGKDVESLHQKKFPLSHHVSLPFHAS